MFSVKCILLVAACLILTASATPIQYQGIYEPHQGQVYEYHQPILARRVRSPSGNIDFNYKQDQNGREGSVTLNQNLYSSDDGRGTIDAYAQGIRNFDYNQNAFNGGIRGSWRF